MRSFYALAVFGIVGAGLIAACGSNGDGSAFGPGTADSGSGDDGTGTPPLLGPTDGSIDPDAQALMISPADQVLTFALGSAAPTLQYKATTAGGV